MKFSVVINEGPYQHQASDSGFNFSRAVVERGHQLDRVFFYHDGVNNATRLAVPPQDERNITRKWSEFAKANGIDLVVCVAAARRRGIMDAEECRGHGKDADNLADGFRISGLGQLVETAIDSDRLVVFGD